MLSQITSVNTLIKFIEEYLEILKAIKEENEKHIVYSYLLNIVVPNNRYDSRVKRWRFIFSQIKWFSFPVIIYLAMSIIAISLIFVNKIAFLYTMITIFIFLLANALFIMLKEISKNKSNKELIEEKFLRMQCEAINNLYVVIYLRKNASREILKSIEQDFENENKQLQSRANFLSKLIPFLTIIIIVLFLNINIDYKTLNTNNFLYSMFQGSA